MVDEAAPAREIRLALVMNGGISLAVWMGGSTSEIYDVVTAEHVDGERAPGDSSAVLWGKLLKKTNRLVRADIIAGTSAGGLNGALLASCLALGSPFPNLEMHKVWRELPVLRRKKLLREMNHQNAGLSVLDGGYFAEKVGDLFQHVEDAAEEVPSGGDEPGTRADVTCLVTATAIGGESRRVPDDLQWPQHASDHRRVYRFTSRSNRFEYTGSGPCTPKPLYDFTNSAMVAAAARASAGFPVAFEPVLEEAPLLKHREVERARGPT